MVEEKRLIDANELLRDAEDYAPIRGGLADIYDVKWLVDAQFTVDAVEVVRCKDCKHSEPCGESRQCLHPFGLNICDGNDFCSYGERRNNG